MRTIYTADQIKSPRTNLDAAKAMIVSNIQVDDRWLARALVALHDRQTADERLIGNTRHLNGRGFGASDAQILSSFANQARRWLDGQSSYSRPLSPRQRPIAERRLAKYAGQLARIARQNASRGEPRPAPPPRGRGMSNMGTHTRLGPP